MLGEKLCMNPRSTPFSHLVHPMASPFLHISPLKPIHFTQASKSGKSAEDDDLPDPVTKFSIVVVVEVCISSSFFNGWVHAGITNFFLLFSEEGNRAYLVLSKEGDTNNSTEPFALALKKIVLSSFQTCPLNLSLIF